MVNTRREIRALGDTWNDTTLWYAKAVAALLPLPITQKTSWRYLGAMHSFHQGWWQQLGYLAPGEALPPLSEQEVYWKQCQHGSWYFLPWHRAYLLSFEDIVRAQIVALGGPSDWALPYWNYNGTEADAKEIPPAFLEETLPDGSQNALHPAARYPSPIPDGDIDLRPALTEETFTGGSSGPAPGFGGPETPFANGGQDHGLLESMPHDLIHGDVGGEDGLMSYPESAALDPIFWLHHANIDRLWEVWRLRDSSDADPDSNDWLGGPTDRVFAIFDAQGNAIPCNPGDMLSTEALGYEYDDVSDPLPGDTRRDSRLNNLAAAAPGALDFGDEEEAAVADTRKFELLGSNDEEVPLGPEPVTSRIALAQAPNQNWSSSFSASAVDPESPGEPDRVFLVLENIRGKEDSRVLDVYVRAKGEEIHAGAIGLFGVDAASDPDEHHGGGGLNKTLEVTELFDTLRVQGVRPEELEVRIAPRGGARAEDDIRVGQITVHRQSGQ